MRRFQWLTLVALVAAVPACGKDSGTNPSPVLTILNCAKGSHYTIGTTVSGSLTSTDCTDPAGTGRADYYQFTLASAGPVSITVTNTSGANPRVINAILSATGTTTHFRFTNLAGSAVVGGNFAAGTYNVVVAASEDDQTSNYTLTSSATLPPTFGCTSIGSILMGATASGTFASSDCADPDGYAPADYYLFTLGATGPVTLKLTSSSGTAYVGIGDEVDGIYDVGISDPATPGFASATLPAGRYIAIAAASLETQTGPYTLQLTNVATTAAAVPREIPLERVSPWSVRKTARW